MWSVYEIPVGPVDFLTTIARGSSTRGGALALPVPLLAPLDASPWYIDGLPATGQRPFGTPQRGTDCPSPGVEPMVLVAWYQDLGPFFGQPRCLSPFTDLATVGVSCPAYSGSWDMLPCRPYGVELTWPK